VVLREEKLEVLEDEITEIHANEFFHNVYIKKFYLCQHYPENQLQIPIKTF